MDVDFAVFGELDGVSDDVEEELAEADLVAVESVGDVRVDLAVEDDPLFLGADAEEVEGVGEELAEAEVHGLEFEAPGFNF